MNDQKRTSESPLLLPRDAVDRLLERADGEAALLYLYVQRRGAFAPAAAARALGLSTAAVERAARTLRQLGLLSDLPESQLEADELPEYAPAEIAQRARCDSAFEGVVTQAQQMLGRHLNSNDLRILFGIYDHLALPADVIFVLLTHCIDSYQFKNGEGRLPSFRYIEAEARHWARYEINTYAAAEEHIARENLRRRDITQLRELLQIRGRDFTPTERRYAEEWLALGMTLPALALAYDRTVIGTGKLVWKYMDKIVRDWHSRGLLTAEAVEQGDARRGQTAPPAPPPRETGTEVSKEIEQMRRMYEHMKRGT